MRLFGSKQDLSNPFANLTFQQRILQSFRLACPFVAMVFLIALFVLKSDVENCYVVLLNCGHVNLANGIYKILNNLYMRLILQANSTSLNFFLDSNTPKSMVDAMTIFARNEIADAPQVFLIGFDSYCAIRYDTNYDADNVDEVNLNISTSCIEYTFNTKLDYTDILKDNGFKLVATYAYFAEDGDIKSMELVNLKVMFMVVSIILFVLLPILILFTLYVYSNRKGAPNLSKVTKLAHVPLFLSVGACIAMTISFALILQFVKYQMQIVSEGLSKFLISMSFGPLFFGLFIAIFVLISLTMLFWVVPMWCSNPPVIDDSEEKIVRLASQNCAEDVTPSPEGRFNTLLRRKLHKTAESEDKNSTTKESRLSLIHNSENDSSVHLFNSLKKDASEEELRKLGDQLAYRPRVRKSQAVVLEAFKNNSSDSVDDK